ncbi:MAG: class I SAM-dependent methyltransferase [Candidatus Nitrosomaritimum aestuariumsis]
MKLQIIEEKKEKEGYPSWIYQNKIKFKPKVEEDFFIEGDSSNYDILWDCAKEIKGIDGLVLEIGVSLGMSSFVIMNSCIENNDMDRRFFGIDCYGAWAPSFTNQMKIAAKRNLFQFCYDMNIDYTMIELEDTEFFKRYEDGIPVYSRTVWDTKQYKPEDYEWKKICNEYALVHLDGPHRLEDVELESDFFLPRIVAGGFIVYDDIDKPQKYDHDEFEPNIFKAGFELFKKEGTKAAYRKI